MDILLICADDGIAATLPSTGGRGATVLSAPAACQAAQRLFPDRRIEVKPLYGEPRMRFSLLAWMLKPDPDGESAEEVKRRVVDASIRLTQLSKSHGEGSLVGGPRLLRLIAFKLASIGWRGPIVRGFKPGEARRFSFGS